MKKDSIYWIMVFTLILDQVVKFLIRSKMKLLSSISVIPHFFSITYVENEGAAWGILADSTILLVLVSIVAFYLLMRYIQKEHNWNKLKIVSFGFVLGGLIGNLLDRLLYHSVTDYLDFNLFGYHYPVFNIADVLIVIGVFLLIIEIARSEINEHRSKRRKCKN